MAPSTSKASERSAAQGADESIAKTARPAKRSQDMMRTQPHNDMRDVTEQTVLI